MCECLYTAAQEIERNEDAAQEAHGESYRVADEAQCARVQAEAGDHERESADIEGRCDQVQDYDPAVLSHHVGRSGIDVAEDRIDDHDTDRTGQKSEHLRPGLLCRLYRSRVDTHGDFLLIRRNDDGCDRHSEEPQTDEAEVHEDHIDCVLSRICVLRLFLFGNDPEGNIGNGHLKCFFHGSLIIHAHRAIALICVYERVDIIYETEGLTGYLAVGLILERHILTGFDFCLEVLRNLDVVIGDGEIEDIVDAFFRSRCVFYAAVFVDEGPYALAEFAVIVITEKHSEVFVINALLRRRFFVLVDDARSGKDHSRAIDHHDDSRDNDRDLIRFQKLEEILIKLHTFLSLIS